MGERPSVRIITCVGVEFDLTLLPHFISHYRALGVEPDRIHVVLQSDDPASPNLDRADGILAGRGIEAFERWTDPYTSDGLWEKRREVQRRVARPEDWIVSADVDELHEYPAPLDEFLAWCGGMQVNAVQGVFIDRLAPGGELAPTDPEVPLDEQYPVQADVICSLGGVGEHHDLWGSVKLMAFRPELLPSRGGHHPQEGPPARYLYGKVLGRFRRLGRPGFRFASPLKVHHFKWTESLVRNLENRHRHPDASAAAREYGTKLLAYFERNGGVDLSDVPVRRGRLSDGVPWKARVHWLRRLAGLEVRAERMLRAVRP